jgi:hypothetical protein
MADRPPFWGRSLPKRLKMKTEPPESDVAGLKRQLEQEAKRRAWLENLVAEAIHHQYLDRVSCPPTWIAEARIATRRLEPLETPTSGELNVVQRVGCSST